MANGVRMSDANHLDTTISQISRARALVGELRGTVGGGGVAILDKLEQALIAASESANGAAGLMHQQWQRLSELSALVVGSTGRHF
jgi:hypothetical protein